jgi:hypothetical protein
MRQFFNIILLLFSVNVFSSTITCPSVSDIQRSEFHHWLPLYIENEELASAADVTVFQSAVRMFDHATWNAYYLEAGHCVYVGDNPMVKKIEFAHDAWRPSKQQTWVWLQPNRLAECRALKVEECVLDE